MPNDVIKQLFADEISQNRKVILIFAGKIMSENKTLEKYGVEDNFCLHAMIKKSSNNNSTNIEEQKVVPSNEEQEQIEVRNNLLALLQRMRNLQDRQDEDDLEVNRGRVRRAHMRDRNRVLYNGFNRNFDNEEVQQGSLSDFIIGFAAGFFLGWIAVFIMCFCN